MARADLLVVHASQLVTMRGPRRPRRGKELRELSLIDDGAVAIKDGLVVDVGNTAHVRARWTAKETLDAENRAVVPGFLDAHTHLPFAGSRAFELELKLSGKSYLDILRAGGGIHRTVKDTRETPVKDLLAQMKKRLEIMLSWGTTTAEAKSGYGLDEETELKQLHAVRLAQDAQPIDLVPTFLGAHIVPDEYAKKRPDYVRLLTRRVIPRIARESLADFCDAFLEKNAFTAKECTEILEAARRAGLKTKLHADEFTNKGGAELAARLRCTSAEHLLEVSPRGIRALAASDTTAVLLPGVSVTSLLDAYAPARRMIDAGVAVALGTDLNPNCHVLTMPTVLQWACYHLRMRPAEALVAGTLNAAYATGMGGLVGSIEPKKQADLLVLDEENWVDLVYKVGRNPVATVVKKGRIYAGTRASPAS